ncbi:hypothetical protein C8Q76DRAFT_693617 [Earliella scabrosa]|nr:hypothetical protein C8Q76DRAFT_693617 [Earliella scabrosa]
MTISCKIQTKHRQKSVRRDAPDRPDGLLRAHDDLNPGERRSEDERGGEHEDDAARRALVHERPHAVVEAGRDGRERVGERVDEQAGERVEEGEVADLFAEREIRVRRKTYRADDEDEPEGEEPDVGILEEVERAALLRFLHRDDADARGVLRGDVAVARAGARVRAEESSLRLLLRPGRLTAHQKLAEPSLAVLLWVGSIGLSVARIGGIVKKAVEEERPEVAAGTIGSLCATTMMGGSQGGVLMISAEGLAAFSGHLYGACCARFSSARAYSLQFSNSGIDKQSSSDEKLLPEMEGGNIQTGHENSAALSASSTLLCSACRRRSDYGGFRHESYKLCSKLNWMSDQLGHLRIEKHPHHVPSSPSTTWTRGIVCVAKGALRHFQPSMLDSMGTIVTAYCWYLAPSPKGVISGSASVGLHILPVPLTEAAAASSPPCCHDRRNARQFDLTDSAWSLADVSRDPNARGSLAEGRTGRTMGTRRNRHASVHILQREAALASRVVRPDFAVIYASVRLPISEFGDITSENTVIELEAWARHRCPISTMNLPGLATCLFRTLCGQLGYTFDCRDARVSFFLLERAHDSALAKFGSPSFASIAMLRSQARIAPFRMKPPHSSGGQSRVASAEPDSRLLFSLQINSPKSSSAVCDSGMGSHSGSWLAFPHLCLPSRHGINSDNKYITGRPWKAPH